MITVAEAAMIRHRRDVGMLEMCGLDFGEHHWHEVQPPTSDRPIAVICTNCGIMADELLKLLPTEDLDIV